MKHFRLLQAVLNLFDGGSAGAGGQGADSGNQGGTMATPSNTRKGTGDLSNVRYGKQPADESTNNSADAGRDSTSGPQSTSDTLEDRKKAFRDLVTGEYKDIYTEETQGMINRRFRETKQMEQRLQQIQPILDALGAKYQITDGDLGKIQRAMDEDDAYWEDAAEEAGMTVKQFKEVRRLQQQNEQLRAAQRNQQQRSAAQAQLAKWTQEAEAMKSLYPSFNLQQEAQNRQFLSLLQAGVPVQHAYEVLHMDEIKQGIAKMQAKATEQQVVSNVRARGNRPAENGSAVQSGFVVKTDPKKLTKQDRAEIARRVGRGEIISF